ncbi:NAD(P)H-binding protein [Levilactobacillus tujiorum]|uniref:NAD(P)H-binding protein n=1 Tax=Levilactobacillus tujiorum TaxID=2912243 RepID=A0ABX1L8H2_9LACO|nr:NAD(P)H-binding protein [Levilactobacillus tujiorum]MCH5465528.1 NAD(P)H-binding protein [Levilactobacillus tujiorum]NLR12736.1 NAD(P)H-binding protein [Lactobacillus sp. HBUAS51387]NLR30651.1 NAD(P)H-binding protein [Levilactobacillus tujiorum]
MTNVLIIGATGSVGSVTRQYFLDHTDDQLTLMARNTDRLGRLSDREQAIAGSVTDEATLQTALRGQDVVFAALSGNLSGMAKSLVAAMDASGVQRLLFIASMGIYNEIPASLGASGNLRNNPMLQGYRAAADVVEASDLNYTVIRPGWFDNGSDTDYQVTKKGEPFGGHDVSRQSIADLVVRLAHDETLGSRDSLGINRK